MLVVNLNGEGALVGDGATPEEYRTHFSAIASARCRSGLTGIFS